MLHLRIVAPSDLADDVLHLLEEEASACNLIHLPGAAKRPHGDVILVDIAREDASVILADLRDLEVHRHGSISVQEIDFQLSEFMERAVEHARGSPSDAVVWEEVASRTSESAELNWSFVLFMVLAGLLASVGILLNSPILVVGAMVVGPEFGPVAGICVALVERRPRLVLRSLLALAVGFPLTIGLVALATLAYEAIGATPEDFDTAAHSLSGSIANPDFFAFFVAFCAGIAGVLSLTSSKSGALVGVLISVTTIPAAANVGVSAAYGDWDTAAGSLGQLAVNVVALVVAGTLTLAVSHTFYARRRSRHKKDAIRR